MFLSELSEGIEFDSEDYEDEYDFDDEDEEYDFLEEVEGRPRRPRRPLEGLGVLEGLGARVPNVVACKLEGFVLVVGLSVVPIRHKYASLCKFMLRICPTIDKLCRYAETRIFLDTC